MTSSFDVSDYDWLFVISHFFHFRFHAKKYLTMGAIPWYINYKGKVYGRSLWHNASTSSKWQDLNDTKNNKTYPYSLGKLFIYFLFIPKRFLLLASTITICNIALLSSTETGRKFSICHTVKPVMERGGYYFTYINYIE